MGDHIRTVRGFTLIELVLTMLVIVVLAVTAATRIRLEKRDLDAVAKVLRSNLQFAQDLAMTHGSIYGFHVSSFTSYEIFEGAAGFPVTNPLGGQPFVVDMAPVQFSGTPADIAFQASGQPSIAADATITLVGGSSTRIVTVQQDTGFVTIQVVP